MTDPMIVTLPIRLEYDYTPGRAMSEFLAAVARGRFSGRPCPECGKVYVPGRLGCPRCGVPTGDAVDIPDTGVVTTFCIVNVPFAGQAVECPYVSASVLLDGADTPLFHLIQEVDAYEVRMGMRVRAVWVPPEEREPSLLSVKYFAPTGEPDVPFEHLRERL